MRFLSGGQANVRTVAFLPGDLAARIPALSTDILLDGEYARKIWEKHKLGYETLGLIQTIVDRGWCTKTRPNQLDFLYVDDRGLPKYYVLGVKAAQGGKEIWVTTLHPTSEPEIKRRLKRAREKGALVRTASWN
jgi:hypothetical protein